MIQRSELFLRFDRIEKDIDDAVQTCVENIRLPRDLKYNVMLWKRHTAKANIILSSDDDKKINSFVDDMQKIGVRAQAALDDIIGPDTKIRNAVMHANSELADLKWKLHGPVFS